MFGGAEQELFMQSAIDERRMMLTDRAEGLRRDVERMGRDGRSAGGHSGGVGAWLAAVGRTVRAVFRTAGAHGAADSAA